MEFELEPCEQNWFCLMETNVCDGSPMASQHSHRIRRWRSLAHSPKSTSRMITFKTVLEPGGVVLVLFWSCSGLHSVTFGSGSVDVCRAPTKRRESQGLAIRVRVADSIALISIKLCFFFFNLIKIFRFSVIKLMF